MSTCAVLTIDAETRLQELRTQIYAALDGFLTFDEGCPASLAEAMRHSVLGPGKRIRPLLVLLSAEACGGDGIGRIDRMRYTGQGAGPHLQRF